MNKINLNNKRNFIDIPNYKKRNKITILFMIDFLDSQEGLAGGTERQLIDVISELDRTKFIPILICLRQYSHSSHWEGLECEKKIIDVYSILSVKAFVQFLQLVNYIRNNRVDIVQTFFFDSTFLGILAAKLANVHNTISCRRDMGFWYNKKILKILAFVNKFTKKILVNSNAIKNNVVLEEKAPREKVNVIYNGINLKTFDSSAKIDFNKIYDDISITGKIIGLVANFNRQVKRVDLFIKAAAEVVKKEQNVKFLIVGGGKLGNELKQLAKNLGVEDYVIFAGKKDKAIPYIKSFDIGVLTSDSEGFPNVILEYMAAGIPSIATDAGGNNEVVKNGKTGILVPLGDHLSLARAICDLLGNKQKRFAMGQNARRIVCDNYSWEKKIKEIESYYFSLVKQ